MCDLPHTLADGEGRIFPLPSMSQSGIELESVCSVAPPQGNLRQDASGQGDSSSRDQTHSILTKGVISSAAKVLILEQRGLSRTQRYRDNQIQLKIVIFIAKTRPIEKS